MVGILGGVCVDFESHGVVPVAIGGGMDVVGVCADKVVPVDVDGEPVLAVCVFGDSGFHAIWNEDSTFCFGVCVVCVVLGSLHVSRIPVLGFLDQYYSVFSQFDG